MLSRRRATAASHFRVSIRLLSIIAQPLLGGDGFGLCDGIGDADGAGAHRLDAAQVDAA